MKKVSIIIRTKNEEKWIKPCLNSLVSQTYNNFEIILVDNESTDDTLQIVNDHILIKKTTIVYTNNYIPGKALNDGIKKSVGELIVCISAHCIPSSNSWLRDLVAPLSYKENIVATYARQVPMPYSDPDDFRDLLVVFSKDERLQKNDYFFHNAHSAFFRKIWKQFPFSESLTNIEDREFGKNIIDNNYHIYYNPIPTVFHYHGIHQANNKKRLDGVIRIIRSLTGDIEFKDIPEVCSISHVQTLLFIPIIEKELDDNKVHELKSLFTKALKIDSLKKIVLISYNSVFMNFETNDNIIFFDRSSIKDNLKLGVFELIKEVSLKIKSIHQYDIGIYCNHKKNLLEEINKLKSRLINFLNSGGDIVFPAYKDNGYYWFFDEETQKPISFEKELKSMEMRKSLYKANYGLGSIFNLSELKKGDILNKKIVIDEI